MAIYEGIAATCNVIEESWGGTSEFSEEALKQLSETAKDCPVLLNFDNTRQIGRVIESKVEDKKLIIKFLLNEDIDESLRIVPGFYTNKDQWDKTHDKIHRVVENVKSMAYGLTNKPADEDLPSIVKIDDKKIFKNFKIFL